MQEANIPAHPASLPHPCTEGPQCQAVPARLKGAAPCKVMMLRSSWVCWLMFALRLCMVLAVRPRASACTQQLLQPLCPVVPLLACDLGWNWHRGSSRHHTPTPVALHLLAATCPYGMATATHSPLCVSAGDNGSNTVQLPVTEPPKGWAASWDHAQCPITMATAVPSSPALQTL